MGNYRQGSNAYLNEKPCQRPHSSINFAQGISGRYVEQSEAKIKTEMQLKQANTQFQEYVRLMPKFLQIYVMSCQSIERPLNYFSRKLTRFEASLVQRQRIHDSFSWQVISMLFQGVPEVDFGNELAQFSFLAKNNEYFRINVEKDKALVTQQLKRAYEGKG